jgi:DNA polymerase-3 subunit gamma/tau
MLSKSAFNALLKTLEEPPEHVKFIFATTEIRKVPVTILSRCQRFDLKRIDTDTLSDYYKSICDKENVDIDEEALFMIARAADGSVRDGLSLLDQAIALSNDKISVLKVQEMLGMADKVKILDMLEKILEGDTKSALESMDDLHKNGADSLYVLQDMLSYIHLLTRLKAVPDLAHYKNIVSADLAERLKELSNSLSMPTLGKSWQILLKGINEVNNAPNMQEAAEMVIIRLLYASNLPDPQDLLKKLQSSNEDKNMGASLQSQTVTPQASINQSMAPNPVSTERASSGTSVATALKVEPETAAEESLQSLEDIVALLESHKEVVMASQLYYHAHLVKFGTYRLEFNLEPEAQPNLLLDLRKFLIRATGQQWMISTSKQNGEPTLYEKQQQKEKESLLRAQKNPLVSEILTFFPDAELKVTKKNH